MKHQQDRHQLQIFIPSGTRTYNPQILVKEASAITPSAKTEDVNLHTYSNKQDPYLYNGQVIIHILLCPWNRTIINAAINALIDKSLSDIMNAKNPAIPRAGNKIGLQDEKLSKQR